MNKKFLALLIVLSCFFLSGCVELAQEVWINPDGSARLLIDIGIVREEIPIFGTSGVKDAIDQSRQSMIKDMGQKKETLEKFSHVKSVKISQVYEEGKDKLDHFIYEVHTRDVYKLNEIFQEIRRDQLDEEADWTINVSKLENKNILFVQRFASTRSPEETSKDEYAGPKRYFSITLHAPKIVSTNGALDKYGKIATWKISFDELPHSSSAKRELIAEIQLPKVRFLFILVIFAVILVVITIIKVWGHT